MTMLSRPEKHTKGRVKNKKPNSIRVVSAVAASSTVTLTFDQIVTLQKGAVPEYVTDVVGANPLSATQPSPMTVVITYSAAVAAATELTLAVQDPAIRNAAGGFVADTTFPC